MNVFFWLVVLLATILSARMIAFLYGMKRRDEARSELRHVARWGFEILQTRGANFSEKDQDSIRTIVNCVDTFDRLLGDTVTGRKVSYEEWVMPWFELRRAHRSSDAIQPFRRAATQASKAALSGLLPFEFSVIQPDWIWLVFFRFFIRALFISGTTHRIASAQRFQAAEREYKKGSHA